MSVVQGINSHGLLEVDGAKSARDEFVMTLMKELTAISKKEERTLLDYVRAVNPGLLKFEHVPRLLDVGERVITGELQNVLILAPPRYFKTEVFGRLLGSAYLERHPRRMVGLSSYGADLAWSISEEARGYYTMYGGALNRDTSAKKRWRTTLGGEMWAAGVGGPLLGFGYHLGIIDDPTDPEKAHSQAYIRRFTEWYPRKFLSRGEPGAQKVFVMQRLGVNDPVDFLFRREVGDETDLAPENWHVVLCDEIKSTERIAQYDGPLGLPPTCTLEPDDRKTGMVLAPSRMSEKQVLKRQQVSGPVTAATQRQQRPTAPEGDFWQVEWFETYDTLPEEAYNLGWDWDLAYTKNEANSASAGVRSARGPGKKDQFTIYIEDIDWDWLEFPELIALIKQKDGPHYIEDKASGKSAEQSLKREGVSAHPVKVDKDKFSRATHVQPVVSNLRVKVNRRILRTLLHGSKQGLVNIRAEDLARDKGDLDLNDAFVQAITRHVGRRGRKRRFAFVPGSDEEAA